MSVSISDINGFKTATFTGTGTLFNATRQLGGATIAIIKGYSNIGNSAFASASKLTNITIQSSVKTIGISAFRGAISLTSITIPSIVTSIGNEAFLGSGLTIAYLITPIRIDTTNTTDSFFGKKNVSIIKTKIFTGNETLKSATEQLEGATLAIIEGYASIGDEAFKLSMKEYLTTYAYGNATTAEWKRCIEKVSGKNMTDRIMPCRAAPSSSTDVAHGTADRAAATGTAAPPPPAGSALP